MNKVSKDLRITLISVSVMLIISAVSLLGYNRDNLRGPGLSILCALFATFTLGTLFGIYVSSNTSDTKTEKISTDLRI